MIQFVTWPSDLAHWNLEKDGPFYLELYGETRPEVDERYVEVLSLAEEQHGLKEGARLAPLYECCWSLGYLDHETKHSPESWGNLADTAAEVYLYFPSAGGWRIQELIATVKYLCPARDHVSLLQEAAHLFATAQPIIEDASKLAGSASWVPGMGMAATGTAALLDTIAKLKLTSVPPAKGYEWSVQKVARHVTGEGLLHGVKWTLPKKLFVELGTRLTGSIAISVVPAELQSDPGRAEPDSLERRPVRASAVIHAHPAILRGGKAISLPAHGFVELQVQPKRTVGTRRATSDRQKTREGLLDAEPVAR
jgi:hypothetical protein